MKLEKFQETFNGAPYSLDDFANAASKVTDEDDLKDAARAFLKAKEKFETVLETYDVEVG